MTDASEGPEWIWIVPRDVFHWTEHPDRAAAIEYIRSDSAAHKEVEEYKDIRILLMQALAYATERPHTRKEVAKNVAMAEGPVTLACNYQNKVVKPLRAEIVRLERALTFARAEAERLEERHKFLFHALKNIGNDRKSADDIKAYVEAVVAHDRAALSKENGNG